MWPALKALKAMGGSGSNEEMLEKIIELENIPENIQIVIHSDQRRTRLAYNLAWARTYLKWAGAVENSSRGVWSLTKVGESMTEDECRKIPARLRRKDSGRKREKRPKADQVAGDAPPIDETSGEESWKDTLIETLRQMPPDRFERLAQRILREAGFIKVEVTGRSGDGGIDGLGVLRVNLLSFQVLFQLQAIPGNSRCQCRARLSRRHGRTLR
jgi:restriction system protein